jgi:osmotically-inducible protein OsmY
MQSMQKKAIADGLEKAIAEKAARRRLAASGRRPLQNVACRFSQGTMFLSGDVPTYFHKQAAQEMIRSLSGVTKIVNHITVST